jgi:DNA-binding response OmpR family regulator
MAGKILVIEDDLVLVKILALHLEKAGFILIVANDGTNGLAIAQKEAPDLIILDLILPELPGEEVCRQVRKNPKICETPIIMLTAKSEDTDRVFGRVIGADCYMTKPVEIQRLLVKVGGLIRQH